MYTRSHFLPILNTSLAFCGRQDEDNTFCGGRGLVFFEIGLLCVIVLVVLELNLQTGWPQTHKNLPVTAFPEL